MREILGAANRDLLRQIELLEGLLRRTEVPAELTPYVQTVSALCAELGQRALRNLRDLEYDLPQTLQDILHATQWLTNQFEVLNTRFATPVVRSRPEDRLVLLVLKWLHQAHASTRRVPFGFTDGQFMVYPTVELPPVYFLPTSRQRTLLYLPLFFHEFGHVLYTCHEPELADLIKEFQQAVSDQLAPLTIRARDADQQGDTFRAEVVGAWFSWVQEFFGDAVGLTIGGPCFLKAFSHLFRTRSEQQYHVPRAEQVGREHPVTWLRTRMLADRARKLGFARLADQVTRSWQAVADTMGVVEDYEGTWTEDLFVPLRRTLDDMLEEAGPRCHSAQDVQVPPDTECANPVRLCSSAWARFESAPDSYARWEREAVDAFLAAG